MKSRKQYGHSGMSSAGTGGWQPKSESLQRLEFQAGPGIALLLFLAALGMSAMLVWGFVLPSWRANHRYQPNTCVVLDKKVSTDVGDLRIQHEPRIAPSGISFYPEIKIRYEVDHAQYEIWTYEEVHTGYSDQSSTQAMIDRFQVGVSYPCWYDPERPSSAILVRSSGWFWYFLLVLSMGFLVVASLNSRILGRCGRAGRVGVGRELMRYETLGRPSLWGLG